MERSTLPRAIGLTLAAIVASGACILMGMWQGSRTLDILEAERAAASAPVQVLAAMSPDGYPGESIGRPVTATGAYGSQEQLLVDHRAFEGRDGAWVISPFVVDGATVAVLRGWVAAPDSPALAVPTSEVALAGVLQPFEEFYSEAPRRPDGQLVAISRTAIEDAWQTPVLPLVLVLAEQTPPSAPAPSPVPATVQTGGVPFPLQNAGYTLQWFAFAIFVWVAWWMLLRKPRQREDAEPRGADSLGA